MPKFRCQVCQNEVDGMLFKCPQCGGLATLKEVTDAASSHESSEQSLPAEIPVTPPDDKAPTPTEFGASAANRDSSHGEARSFSAVGDDESSAPKSEPPDTRMEAAQSPVPVTPDDAAAVDRVEPPGGSPSPAASPTIAADPRAPSQPGQLAWRYPNDKVEWDAAHRPLRGCPVVDDEGNVFVCAQHQLLMFAPNSETPEWRYDTGGTIPQSAAIGPDGDVRIHSEDGFLHIVGSDGRAAVDPIPVGEPLGWASPLVDEVGNTWVSRRDGGLTKIDSAGETEKRPFFRTRRRFDCAGLILRETLYIGCEDHYLYAIPLNRNRGENVWADSTERGRTGGGIHCPIAVVDDSELIVVSQDDHLYSFGIDGQQQWSVPLPGHALSAPVIDEHGTIFLGVIQHPRNQDARGSLVSIGRRTRKIEWQYGADAAIESTPVIGDDGTLYFGDNSGTIHAIDSRGKRVWKTKLHAPVRSAGSIIATGHVAFGLDDGSLVILKCSSSGLNAAGWPKLHGSLRHGATLPDD
ncbi:MAG: PQQ-binding-like beta-propeller repeat protein [Pirellulaceae bacterium]